jgi:GMP synthase (glutamine-hydrolysing)
MRTIDLKLIGILNRYLSSIRPKNHQNRKPIILAASLSSMAINAQRFIEDAIAEIKHDVQGRAIIGLSGGVDSSLCAKLAHRALGYRLVPIYVDSGPMRQSESDWIEQLFQGIGLMRVCAEKRFLEALRGFIDQEEKRKIVDETFIRVFEERASKIGGNCLIQGTIYPDRIE